MFFLPHLHSSSNTNVCLYVIKVFPPYNGFGSLEDSLQSCLSLVPQPPKKDFIKMLENDHKILRYAANLVRMFSLIHFPTSEIANVGNLVDDHYLILSEK